MPPFNKCFCVGSGSGWPQCKQCIDWASQGNRGQHGNREECCPECPEASRMVWGRGREVGHELAKQRTRENVLGRGQQGNGLELSPSTLPAGMSAFLPAEWGGGGGVGKGVRGR